MKKFKVRLKDVSNQTIEASSQTIEAENYRLQGNDYKFVVNETESGFDVVATVQRENILSIEEEK